MTILAGLMGYGLALHQWAPGSNDGGETSKSLIPAGIRLFYFNT